MKLVTPTAPLISALEAASAAISPRLKMPILMSCLIEVHKDGILRISADSLEARMCLTLDGAQADSSFSFLVAPRLFRAALRGDEATITYHDQRLVIESGGVTKLLCQDPNDFPKPWDRIECSEVDSVKFLGALKMCVACVSSEADAVKSSVFWDLEKQRMFGCNGTFIGIAPLPLQSVRSFILPSNQVRIILASFEVGDDLKVGIQWPNMCLEQGSKKAWFRFIEGNIMRIPEIKVEPMAKINREAFILGLASLEAFFDADFCRTTVTSQLGEWTLQTKSLNGESSVVITGVEEFGDVEPFTFRADALLKVMRLWTADMISVRREINVLTFSPDDSSGCHAIASLFIAP